MTNAVLSPEEFQRFTALAEVIPDETLRTNALTLLQEMTEVIEGVSDRTITWKPSFLRIIQGTTKNLDRFYKGEHKDAPDIKSGTMIIGNQSIPHGIEVIPLISWYSRTLWDSKDDDNGRAICQSQDAKLGWRYGDCKKCEFSSAPEGKVPDCKKEISVMAITGDLRSIIVVKYHKSFYTTGNEWLKEIGNSRANPFERVYTLTGSLSSKKKAGYEPVPRLKGVTRNLVSPEVRTFIEALFRKTLKDRTDMLKAVSESINARLIARANGDTGQAIEHVQETPLEDVTPGTDTGEGSGYVV